MSDGEDLHPYDGRTRCFGHDDAEPEHRARGCALVARLLGLPAPPATEGLCYSLSFHSGGSGVLDRLHVTMPSTEQAVEVIATRLGLVTLEAMQAEARGELEWLVHDDEHPERTLAEALAAFIDRERAKFQPSPRAEARVWLAPESDVNTWTLVYAVDGELAFLAYDQG